MDFTGFPFCRGSIGPPYKIRKLWPRATKEPLQNQKQWQSAVKSLRDMCLRKRLQNQKHTPRATEASTKSGTWAKGQLSLYRLHRQDEKNWNSSCLYKMEFCACHGFQGRPMFFHTTPSTKWYFVFLRAFLVPSSYSAQMCAHATFLIL